MIIIKNNPNDGLKILVGEMLNLEAGQRLFSNGELLETSEGLPGSYPSFTIGSRVFNNNRLSAGIIYVSYECDMKELMKDIISLICKMEMLIPDHMKNYQAVSVGIHTQKSMVSYQKTTRSDPPVIRMRNVKRHIYTNGDSEKTKISARFRWNIRYLQRFTYDNPSISRYCAIIYDVNNIITHPHNTIVYTEDLPSIMSAYSNVINTRAHLLMKNSRLDLMKLDDRDKHEIYNFYRLYAVDFNNLFTADYSKFKFTSGNCEMCSSFLYGDNYVFIADGDTIPICPMCVHSRNIDASIINNLQHTYRVTFPTDIYDYINSIEDELSRDIYFSTYSSLSIRQVILNNGREIDYYIMGNKYAGFVDIDNYVYTELIHLEQLKKYKVLSVKLNKY
jgi:hypothetical protein